MVQLRIMIYFSVLPTSIIYAVRVWIELMLAKSKVQKTKPLIIGITGSYGKTSTKILLSSVLKKKFSVFRTPKSYNTKFSVARSINRGYRGEQVMVLEYGAYKKGERMLLNHIALFCSSEEESDSFYCRLLGLKKVNSRLLPSTLAEEIFGIRDELQLINYKNDDISIEVFIGNDKYSDASKIGHVCVEVDDREAFIKEYEAMNLTINKILRDESFLLFIKDFDGNLFEIKEKQK